ncbi:hypothetical protein [Wukongibacter sp. M2B1]|uniref:HlyD family secretion protein n=1 Tax=Wukongibacter sp. M2B1 TaxID=3088895 RepID=UPI003D7BE52E
MDGYSNINNEKKQKIFKRVIVIFFSTMLILTFFSKTIQNLSLPTVILSQPHSGVLTYEITGFGNIVPKEVIKLYPSSTKKVKDINVEVGEKVKKGQIIAILHNEVSNPKLTEEKIKLKALETNLEKTLLNTKNTEIENLELEVAKAMKKLENLQRNFDQKKQLVELGAEATDNLNEAQYDLEIAEEECKQKKLKLKTAKENQQISLNRQKKEIESLKYDIQTQQLKINQLKEEELLISPYDGIVKEIYYQNSDLAFYDKPLCLIVNPKKGFVFSANIENDNENIVSVGDSISIILKYKNKTMDKTIEKIITKDNCKKLISEIDEVDFFGGEKYKYRIIKKSKPFDTLIPSTALGKDNSGNFIFLINEREGALGKEYYVKKEYVVIGDNDDQNTVILKGLDNRTCIIYDFSKPIYEDCRVRPTQRK